MTCAHIKDYIRTQTNSPPYCDDLDGEYGYVLVKENPTAKDIAIRNYVRQSNAIKKSILQREATGDIFKNGFTAQDTALYKILDKATQTAIDKALEKIGLTAKP
jgi:hypothetical protein